MIVNSSDWISQADSTYAGYQTTDVEGLDFPNNHQILFSGNRGLGPWGIADKDPNQVVVSDRNNWVDANGAVVSLNRITQTPGT